MFENKWSSRLPGLILTTIILLICNCDGENQTKPIIDIDPPPDGSAFDKRACWSETHDLIAYAHARAWSYLNDPDSAGIYLINPDGTEKRLFLMAERVRGIDWSPDGDWIVANIGSELWKISYPGGIVDTILTSGEYYYPSWSPDGTSICYADHLGANRGIYIVDSNGLNRELIIPYGHNPVWVYMDSLAYINFDTILTAGSLCMANLMNNQKRVIFEIGDSFVPGSLLPRINRLSRKLVVQAQIPGQMPGIWKLGLDNPSATLLIDSGSYPNFSPDGSKIVFTRLGEPYANLWTINWDGTGLRQLTESRYE